MKCEIKDRHQVIDDYLAGALSDKEMETFEEHCFNCDICFQELRWKEGMVDLIKEEGNILFADYLEKQQAKKTNILQSLVNKLPRFNWSWLRHPQWIYATVAFGAMVILCFFIFRKLPQTIDTNRIAKTKNIEVKQDSMAAKEDAFVDQKDSVDNTEQIHVARLEKSPATGEAGVKEKAKKEEIVRNEAEEMHQIYAENFETLPYLEDMISDMTRSEEVLILSPKNNETIKGEILFQWKTANNKTISLKILDNHGNQLFEFTTENNQFHFTEKLTPGLYYWKLESEDELLYVGKFFMGKGK